MSFVKKKLLFISWEDDHSRVVLKVDDAIPSDYINANYIDVSYDMSLFILLFIFLKNILMELKCFWLFVSLCVYLNVAIFKDGYCMIFKL